MPISQTPAAAAATGENNEEEKSMAICRNYGCGKRFRLNAPDDDKDDAQRRNADECRYHSGDQNFVDGLKWWSCCGDKIKVTDFNAFLNIPVCAQPTEFDIDPIVTGKYIEILIYSSLIDPDSIRISSNNQILKIKFNHYDRSGNKLSADEEVKLAKLCDSSRSEASLSRMKLEIKMAI
ncbi:MAG: Cysteine and histidine-rich domain-containing protein 1 [Marteilia pararefringens]